MYKQQEKDEVSKHVRLLEHGLESRDPILLGTAVDNLTNLGISLDQLTDNGMSTDPTTHPDFPYLMDQYRAEQILFQDKCDRLRQAKPISPIQRWEGNRTPSTRNGYRRALRDYHARNEMKLPEGFWKRNKLQLAGMYFGILRSQEEG